MTEGEKGKQLGFWVAALVVGAAGAAAAMVWLHDGGLAPGLLAGVLLSLSLVAGPVRSLRAHSRSRLHAVLDEFADRQLAGERQRRRMRQKSPDSLRSVSRR